jgi:hypothetical protein
MWPDRTCLSTSRPQQLTITRQRFGNAKIAKALGRQPIWKMGERRHFFYILLKKCFEPLAKVRQKDETRKASEKVIRDSNGNSARYFLVVWSAHPAETARITFERRQSGSSSGGLLQEAPLRNCRRRDSSFSTPYR